MWMAAPNGGDSSQKTVDNGHRRRARSRHQGLEERDVRREAVLKVSQIEAEECIGGGSRALQQADAGLVEDGIGIRVVRRIVEDERLDRRVAVHVQTQSVSEAEGQTGPALCGLMHEATSHAGGQSGLALCGVMH